jgi:transposase InsO family protein
VRDAGSGCALRTQRILILGLELACHTGLYFGRHRRRPREGRRCAADADTLILADIRQIQNEQESPALILFRRDVSDGHIGTGHRTVAVDGGLARSVSRLQEGWQARHGQRRSRYGQGQVLAVVARHTAHRHARHRGADCPTRLVRRGEYLAAQAARHVVARLKAFRCMGVGQAGGQQDAAGCFLHDGHARLLLWFNFVLQDSERKRPAAAKRQGKNPRRG